MKLMNWIIFISLGQWVGPQQSEIILNNFQVMLRNVIHIKYFQKLHKQESKVRNDDHTSLFHVQSGDLSQSFMQIYDCVFMWQNFLCNSQSSVAYKIWCKNFSNHKRRQKILLLIRNDTGATLKTFWHEKNALIVCKRLLNLGLFSALKRRKIMSTLNSHSIKSKVHFCMRFFASWR